jgi:phosphoglycolate phosphatase
MKTKKTLLFDLVGTLIDSVPDLALAVNEMLESLGMGGYTQDTIRYWVGNGAPMLIKRALVGKVDVGDDEIDDSLYQKAKDIYMKSYAKNLSKATKEYQCVSETLDILYHRGFDMAIVTNKPYEFVPPLLQGLGLEKYFKLIFGGDSCKAKKPNPAMLECVLKEFGANIDDAMMIGDSKNDIQAANTIGMQSIAVTYGYNYKEDISVYSPTYVVDRFDKILGVLL